MADFPALEVMMVSGHGPPAGTRVPITEHPFRIGRAPRLATSLTAPGGLLFNSTQLARNHAEVAFEYGRWWVRDLGSTNGSFFRGERIHDAELQHGDCFELSHGVVFRLLLHEPVEPSEPVLERALQSQPDADEPWSVYADWLQEQGDPLGERLAAPRSEDDARWLEPFAGYFVRGDVEVAWSHGLPSSVVLRQLRPGRADVTWAQRFATLLRQRAFRFVRRLEVDIGSFGVEEPTPRWGQRALYALGADALPLLQHLVIGPCTVALTAEDRRTLDEALAARRAKHPGFLTRLEELFRPWGPARLAAGERSMPLPPRGHEFPGDSQFMRGASPMYFTFNEDRWTLHCPEQTVRVNGRRSAWFTLRPGDRIEVAGDAPVLHFYG